MKWRQFLWLILSVGFASCQSSSSSERIFDEWDRFLEDSAVNWESIRTSWMELTLGRQTPLSVQIRIVGARSQDADQRYLFIIKALSRTRNGLRSELLRFPSLEDSGLGTLSLHRDEKVCQSGACLWVEFYTKMVGKEIFEKIMTLAEEGESFVFKGQRQSVSFTFPPKVLKRLAEEVGRLR